MRRTVLAALLLTAAAAARAEAQTLNHVSVGAGFGSSVGVATDDSAAKKTYIGSIRYDVRPHLAVEGEVAQWGREVRYSSPQGSTVSSDSTWEGTFNLIWHTTGRVSVFGGGGLGFGVTHRDYVTDYQGKQQSLPRDGSGATLQGLGGVEGTLTERIGAFASVGARTGYLYGPSTLFALAGVRIRIR